MAYEIEDKDHMSVNTTGGPGGSGGSGGQGRNGTSGFEGTRDSVQNGSHHRHIRTEEKHFGSDTGGRDFEVEKDGGFKGGFGPWAAHVDLGGGEMVYHSGGDGSRAGNGGNAGAGGLPGYSGTAIIHLTSSAEDVNLTSPPLTAVVDGNPGNPGSAGRNGTIYEGRLRGGGFPEGRIGGSYMDNGKHRWARQDRYWSEAGFRVERAGQDLPGNQGNTVPSNVVRTAPSALTALDRNVDDFQAFFLAQAINPATAPWLNRVPGIL